MGLWLTSAGAGHLAAFAQAAELDLVTFDREFHVRYRSVRVVPLA